MPVSERGGANSLALAAQGLWEFGDLASFRSGLPAQLRALLDCDVASYNEIGPGAQDVFVTADPPLLPGMFSGAFEVFGELILQNPLAAYMASTGDTRALRMSDFISSRKLHSLELYDVLYRHLDTEYQLAFTMPAATQLIGVTVSRGRHDFSAGELDLFDELRGLVVGAYLNLHERARLDVVLRGLEEVDEGLSAVALVEASGVLVPAHGRAERLLRELSHDESAIVALGDWARMQRRGVGTMHRFTLGTHAGELEARYVRGSPGNLDALALRLLPDCHAQALRVLGLTNRQADVLHLIWQGQANAQIALALGISEHTVRHHLEDIYKRLSVSSRAGAAQLATRVLVGAGAVGV
jgi:DNA-binding CsgD family transcriptional regulator